MNEKTSQRTAKTIEQTREERLKSALKANIQRRKAQMRARAETGKKKG